MKILKQIIKPAQEAVTKDLIIFDNLEEYLNCLDKKGQNKYEDFENWKKITIDNIDYHGCSNVYLTDNCYQKLLEMCKLVYGINGYDLLHCDKEDRVSKNFETVEELLQFVRQEWLPDIFNFIDKDICFYNEQINTLKTKINILQDKINMLKHDKELMSKDEYLKGVVQKRYILERSPKQNRKD